MLSLFKIYDLFLTIKKCPTTDSEWIHYFPAHSLQTYPETSPLLWSHSLKNVLADFPDFLFFLSCAAKNCWALWLEFFQTELLLIASSSICADWSCCFVLPSNDFAWSSKDSVSFCNASLLILYRRLSYISLTSIIWISLACRSGCMILIDFILKSDRLWSGLSFM